MAKKRRSKISSLKKKQNKLIAIIKKKRRKTRSFFKKRYRKARSLFKKKQKTLRAKIKRIRRKQKKLFQKNHNTTKRINKKKRLLTVLVATLGVVFIANIWVGLTYKDKTLPRTTINQKDFSSISYESLGSAIKKADLLPKKITFSHKSASNEYDLNELGVEVDVSRAVQVSKEQKNKFFPLMSFFSTHSIVAPVHVDDKKFNVTFSDIEKNFNKSPKGAKIIQQNGNFTIQPEEAGVKLHKTQVKEQLSEQIGKSTKKINLNAEEVKPDVVGSSLKSELEKLESQRSTSILFKFQSKNRKLTKQEVGALFVESGNTLELSTPRIMAMISGVGGGFGIRVDNISSATSAVRDAIQNNKPLEYSLKQLIVKRTYSYCVRMKGVDEGNRGAFEQKLASTYADSRGWSLGGQVTFVRVSGGCSFTVWLSDANLMPTFGAICDSTWSCTASPNVVINFNRWSGASPAWNGGGGSLDDYRSMVINHETGHWLGFYHRFCAGGGQPAPVMQQQSISLQGCAFNPWPNSSEKASLRSTLGL